MEDEAPTEVRLVGYPVRLGERQQEHLDEVSRELMLLSTSRPEFRERVPHRLLELLEQLASPSTSGLDAFRREQRAGDGETVDLVYPAPADAGAAVTAWRSVLQEVDAYCRNDDLLALAAPADVVALREWIVSEFLRQLAGHPPTPWPGPAAG